MTTFILNCVYFILGLFIFIQDICNLSIGRGFKFLCKYITGPADGTVTETIDKSPNHLAVLFTDCSLINYNCIADIISHSLDNGIQRITFYDPWSIIYNSRKKIQSFLMTRSKAKYFNGELSFNGDDLDLSHIINVNFLGARHGSDAMVRACKKLSQSMESITTKKIREYLSAKEGIHEPDLLVNIGSEYCLLAGYPPFSLRVTELINVRRFRADETITADEFYSLMKQFSVRDRRLGK